MAEGPENTQTNNFDNKRQNKMSYFQNLRSVCPQLQNMIDSEFVTNGAGNGIIEENMPLLEFIVANNPAIEANMLPGGGKTRTMQVIYENFLTEDGVVANVANPTCDSNDQNGQNFVNYEIDTTQNFASGEYWEAADFEKFCEANGSFIQRQLLKHINRLDRRVATYVMDSLAGMAGAWNATLNASSEFTVTADTLIVSTELASGDPEPFTLQTIKAALKATNYNDNVLVAADYPLFMYADKFQSGCCASNGFDLGDIQSRFGMAVAYDKRVAGSFGANHAVAVQGGAVSLLMYTRAQWKDGMPAQILSGSDYIQTAVASPWTGVTYDVIWKDDCGKLSLNVIATPKLVGLPADLFPAGSDYDGINYVGAIEVVNA